MAHDAGAVVPLRLLAAQAADAGYQQLAALTQALPGRPEEERRREVMRALHALRQRLLRLLVLVRWSPRAESALQFVKIREALASRDATFHDVATRLAAAHHTTALEPVFDAPAALRVLSVGRLENAECLLPAAVEELRPAPPPPPAPGRLEAAVRARLLRTPLPARLRVLRVVDGMATLGVAREFEADLTLGPFRDAATVAADAAGSAAAARRGGWVLVRVRLLVRAAGAPAACALSEAHHRLLCWQLTQRMSGSADPLAVLLFVLQELCALATRDIAVKQAKELVAGRWAGALRLSALPGSPAPLGFALHFWNPPAPRAAADIAAGAERAAAAPAAGRALRLQLDAERRLVCVHEPPLDGDADGPQLLPDAISVDALLNAAVAAASRQQLAAVQAALRCDPALAALPAAALRPGAGAEDAPSLVLPFPAVAGGAPPSLRCDWRTGTLRLCDGAQPLLSPSLLRELDEFAARASPAEAAARIVPELWRRSVCGEVAQLARTLGLRPLASPKCALRYPAGAAVPDVLLQLPPAPAALYLAVYLDRSGAPTAERAKLVLLAGRAAQATLPVPTDALPVVPDAAIPGAEASDGWQARLSAYTEWAAVHGARVALEAQLQALRAPFSLLVVPGTTGAQLLLDASWVAPGADTAACVRFAGPHEAAWSAVLPQLAAQAAPPQCSGMLRATPPGVLLRYAHADEHLGGGAAALFGDIRALTEAKQQQQSSA